MFLKIKKQNDEERPVKKRLSEIGGQEIINLYDGGRLGVVADIDLLINDQTGAIESLLIPESSNFISIFKEKDFIEVPWDSVRKIGQDTLIVELDEKKARGKKI